MRFIVPPIVLLFFIICQGVYAETLNGIVLRVSDGDTITLLTNNKKRINVRLAYIDAPELNQVFGQISKLKLKKLLNAQTVKIDVHTLDKWDRLVGTVYLNNQDINLEMINMGMAWHYKLYARSQVHSARLLYKNAEQHAKKMGIGLWANTEQIPPWDWRHSEKHYTIK